MEQDSRSTADNQISGMVNAPTVQAGFIEGGVHFHLAGDGAEHAAPSQSPESWADLPGLLDLPVEVVSLLRAQIQTAQQLPYRLPGARRPSLATVYVRQDLGSGSVASESEPQRPTPIVDGRGQLVDPKTGPVVRVAVRAPSRTVRDVLDDQDHLLVTGGPGQGKSTLSLRLAADVAARWLSPGIDGVPLGEPVLPLRVTARELVGWLAMPFPEALEATVRAEYGALLKTLASARTLGERVAGCRWLLLVDGLDEVADSGQRDRLVTILAAWASEADSPYRVVLTTRPVESSAFAPLQRLGAARYELQPFDDEALRRFAHSWFDDPDDAGRFVRQIRMAHLDELMRVPLLATIAAIVFSQHRDRPLPDNQYELYESYLNYLRSAHPVPPSPFDAACDALLEHLGRVRLDLDTSLVAAARTWVEQHLPGLVGNWQDRLITYLAAVGPLARRGDDLGFLHHSFAEHLAATAYARLLPEPFEPDHAAFARLLHAARPEERGQHARAVLVHYTQLHTAQADGLLGWLHAGDGDQHLLAARLLAGHIPAGREVVDAFLTKVRAWAMTTQYPGQQILEQASHAAHHPGIADWLAGLLGDDEAPWQSRIKAAAALSARLRASHMAAAAALLRRVANNPAILVADRLAAAEALSDSGGSECDGAERSLRSVLADPLATAMDCRNAAVTLAGLGRTAREYATGALVAILDDPWTPDADLVEAATGLIEIGFEFAERAAEVFRRILASRTRFDAGLRDAAVGLASLGPQQLEEAVSAVTALVSNRRLEFPDRIRAIDVLAELGPQHRISAGDLLLALSAEFNVGRSEQHLVATSLAHKGLHDDALRCLRAVLADPMASLNAQRWTAKVLADLGPDHQDEAARILQRVAGHPLTATYDRAGALAELAALGEPHRTLATAELHRMLTDPGTEPVLRCEVASRLAQLGPEFHSDVAHHMVQIVLRPGDPDVRLDALRTVRDLGGRAFEAVAVELPTLAGATERTPWEYTCVRWYVTRWHSLEAQAGAIADQLGVILHDPSWPGECRAEAAGALVTFGRRYHRIALEGTLDLVRSGAVPADHLPLVARRLGQLGSAPRAQLAGELRAIACDPHATPITVCRVTEAVELLDHEAGPDVIALVRRIAADVRAEPGVRDLAALALARAACEEVDAAVGVVMDIRERRLSYRWEEHVRTLAVLGADVVPGLRTVMSDSSADRAMRGIAAGILAQLCPELRAQALDELQAQARDEFLDSEPRAEAVRRLAAINRETVGDAIAFHRATVNDEHQAMGVRCRAANELSRLDESSGSAAVAALRRFATSPELTASEREDAAEQLAATYPWRTPEAGQVAVLLARDPAATFSGSGRLRWSCSGTVAQEIDQLFLADHTRSPIERIGCLNEWDYSTLVPDAEAMLREVLRAPETLPTERVQAATALAELSPRHLPEAVHLLVELCADHRIRRRAQHALADLDHSHRLRLVAEAVGVVTDDACGWRQRLHAASLVWELTSQPPDAVVNVTRQLVRDPRLADASRVVMLYAMRPVDGLDPLRAVRDDRGAQPAIRWAAATRLRRHAVDDRAIGAKVLHDIANDDTCRLALRWRVGRDLFEFGDRGRELGTVTLQAIMTDEFGSVRPRAEAARALAQQRPDHRGAVLRFLRRLRTVGQPDARLHALTTIGLFDTIESTLELQGMARDQALDAGVRLRAASAMAALRRDCREPAAAIAREVMWDEHVACHLRVKAARALARWSDLCRDEARSLLIELDRTVVG